MQQQQGKINYDASCATLKEWPSTSKYVGTATSVLQLRIRQGSLTHDQKVLHHSNSTVPDSIPQMTTQKGATPLGTRFDARHRIQMCHKNWHSGTSSRFHDKSTMQMQQKQGKIDYDASWPPSTSGRLQANTQERQPVCCS